MDHTMEMAGVMGVMGVDRGLGKAEDREGKAVVMGEGEANGEGAGEGGESAVQVESAEDREEDFADENEEADVEAWFRVGRKYLDERMRRW